MVEVEEKPSAKHRSRIDIIASILCASEPHAKKTRIMYKCNLSFRQLHVYLSFLAERDLLRIVPADAGESNSTETYETTAKGKAFIQAYRSINAIVSS